MPSTSCEERRKACGLRRYRLIPRCLPSLHSWEAVWIAHKGELHPGQQPALIDDETWVAVRDQLAANTSDYRRKAKAAEPSLLVDPQGERLTPSHAVKKGRRYRYYVSAALITDAGADREGWRLAAREIEEAAIRILADALTSPAGLVERFGAAGIPSDQIRKLLSRAARVKATLGGSPGERAKLIRELVEKVIVDERTIIIKLRRDLLLGGDVPSSASEAASDTCRGPQHLQSPTSSCLAINAADLSS
jgi:site-specific DNA recombinase